jgi:hypothetical protein
MSEDGGKAAGNVTVQQGNPALQRSDNKGVKNPASKRKVLAEKRRG